MSAAAVASIALSTRPARGEKSNRPGLREIAAQKGIDYGAAIRSTRINSVPEYAKTFEKECSIIVAEGEMRWPQFEPSPGQFVYTVPERLVAFARRNGLKMRGHELIRPRSTVGWAAESIRSGNRSNAEKIMERYVSNVVGHFRGSIVNWDVINESLDAWNGVYSRKKNLWYDALGLDYIDLAFHYAHQADPDCQLVCNDNFVEYDLPEHDSKRRDFLDLLAGLKKRNVPCHAVGIQSHLAVGMPFNAKKYGRFLQDIADMDFDIFVTELDVDDNLLGSSIEVQDQAVADAAEEYLNAVVAQPRVKAVLTWGITDALSTLTDIEWAKKVDPDRVARIQGHTPRPLPFDGQFNRKPMWHAMARAFSHAPQRA